MSDPRPTYDGLHWATAAAKIANFSTTGTKGRTTVTIKIVVTNPWELGDLMRQLAELRDGPDLRGTANHD